MEGAENAPVEGDVAPRPAPAEYVYDPNAREEIRNFSEPSEAAESEKPTEPSGSSDDESEAEFTATQRQARQLLPAARDYLRPDTSLQPADMPSDNSEWRAHVLDSDRLVPIPALSWDHDARFGQVRPLRIELVRHYAQRLIAQGDPVRPVDTMLKMLPGVKTSTCW